MTYRVHKVVILTVMGRYDKKDSLRGQVKPTKTVNQNKGFVKLQHYPSFIEKKYCLKKKKAFTLLTSIYLNTRNKKCHVQIYQNFKLKI